MRKVILIECAFLLILNANVIKANFIFGTPKNLGPDINSVYLEGCPCISSDGLSLFFTSDRPGGSGSYDLWMTTRQTTDDSWEEPSNLGQIVNSSSIEFFPSISSDALSLFFTSYRTGGSGDGDLWMTTRETTSHSWREPMNLGSTVNSRQYDGSPSISADGLTLFFESDRSGGMGSYDIWVTTRATISSPWGPPVNLGSPFNYEGFESSPSVSADGYAIFFCSGIPRKAFSDLDIWVSVQTREATNWAEPINLGFTSNSPAEDNTPSISPDGSTLFYCSLRSDGYGDYDLWQVSIEPVVDFNNDGVFDNIDICDMVEHWGADNSIYDIGPMPWGDGIVDVKDLIVLMEYVDRGISDPSLVAYLPLDEIDGNIAHDSAGENDGSVNGNPVWRPINGKKNGALALDGIDDYINMPFVINPAGGAFSAFAWIKGGEQHEVILSQTDSMGFGQIWLGADIQNGTLVTWLQAPYFNSAELVSDYNITDGNWHHVGLVWDESCRYLYVNGGEVARDNEALSGMDGSYGVMHIGADKTLDPVCYWSGLIDDIRIYRRALKPQEVIFLAEQ